MVCNVWFTKMNDVIKHKGIVERVEGSHLVVRIVQTSACAACSAKGLCNASESKEKLIDVYEVKDTYQVGEEVVLCGTTSMGMRAVLLAFGIPVLLLLMVLFIAMKVTDGDSFLAALAALIAIVPYYGLVYLFRDRLNKNFSFTIEKS